MRSRSLINDLSARGKTTNGGKLTHSSVIVKMYLDVAVNHTSQCPDEVIHLSRVCASNGVSDADTIDANLIDGLIYRKEVNKVRAEGVFRREADFNAWNQVQNQNQTTALKGVTRPTLRLDILDNFDGGLGDICHILSM